MQTLQIMNGHESTPWWSKIVVTNTIFWNYLFLNFYQVNMKKGFFANGIWNKIVQNPKNKIVKKNLTLKLILNN
jgi:hypothetical protein